MRHLNQIFKDRLDLLVHNPRLHIVNWRKEVEKVLGRNLNRNDMDSICPYPAITIVLEVDAPSCDGLNELLRTDQFKNRNLVSNTFHDNKIWFNSDDLLLIFRLVLSEGLLQQVHPAVTKLDLHDDET